MHFVLLYHAAPGAQDRKAEVRPAHRAHVEPIARAGKLAFAGPFVDGTGDGLLIIEAASTEEAWKFVADDPYIKGGIFGTVEVRPIQKVFPE